MKNYIANEGINIMTSALHVRRLFTKCIQLGRKYSRENRKEDLHEALRLMGTGLHCLEGEFQLYFAPFKTYETRTRDQTNIHDRLPCA